MCLVTFLFIKATIGKMPKSQMDSEVSKNEDLGLLSQFQGK